MDKEIVKNKAGEGARWSALFSVISITTQILQVTILAILLDPVDFGLRGYTVFCIGLLQILVEFGVGIAIVKEKELSTIQINTIFVINILLSICVYIALFFSSPLIAQFYNEPELIGLLRSLAIILFVSPVGVIYIRLLERNLQLKKATIVEITATVCGVCSTIVFAFLGFRVYSLIYGQIIQEIVRVVGLIVKGNKYWRPGFKLSIQSVKKLYRFGFFQFGESTIYYISNNIDKMILGFLIGTEGLGYYTFTSSIISQPHAKLLPIVNRVALPIFSKIQDDVVLLKKAFLKMIVLFSFLSFPAVLGFAGIAQQIVPVVIGVKWIPAIPLFVLLGIVFLMKTIMSPSGPLGQVKDRIQWIFFSNLIILAIQFPAFYIGAEVSGMIGIALASIVLQFIRISLFYTKIVKYSININIIEFIKEILPYCVVSLIMYFILVFLSGIFPVSLLSVGILIVIGIAIYGLCTFIFFKSTVKYLFNIVLKRNTN